MALMPGPTVPDTDWPRVLLIDDDPVVRDSVRALLKYFGYECRIAGWPSAEKRDARESTVGASGVTVLPWSFRPTEGQPAQEVQGRDVSMRPPSALGDTDAGRPMGPMAIDAA
jgi:hypothetical protein